MIVWDLDETLLLFACFCNGSYANAATMLQSGRQQEGSMEAQDFSITCAELGQRISDALFDLLDSKFFYDQVRIHTVQSAFKHASVKLKRSTNHLSTSTVSKRTRGCFLHARS